MADRHSVLVIGAGSIGERHLRCFLETGRADVSFVEIQATLRGTMASRYGVSGYDSLDAALAANSARGAISAAVIATPAPLHIELATRLADRGIHLLIEKPLDTKIAGIEELRSIAAKHGVTISVAYVYRCFPALSALRDAVCSGRFGRPVELVAVCGQNFPTYRPAYRQTYYTSHANGGGAIQDALTHILNAGEWILGPIDRLVADAAHQVLDGTEVEDTVHLLARHGGVLASYSLNQHQAPNEVSITVVCEGGTARWEAKTQRWRWMLKPDEGWHDEAFEPRQRDAAFIDQAHRFLDAVDGCCPPLCSLDEAAQTLRVNLAALASVRTQTWQSISVTSETGEPSVETGEGEHV